MALGRRPELARHPARELAEVDPLGVELDRVGVELREVEEVGGELGQPRDLLPHRPHELLSRGRVGLLLVEQLHETPEREDRRAQLVRGVGDEVPAGAVEPGEPLLHLVQGAASWPTSSFPSSGIGVEKSPSATFSRGRLEPAEPLRVRPGGDPARRQRGRAARSPGDQDLAPDQGDVVVNVGERGREDRHPARPPPADSGTAASPVRSPAICSTAEARWPLDAAAAAAGELGRSAVRSSSESPTTNPAAGRRARSGPPSRVTRASVRWATSRTRR